MVRLKAIKQLQDKYRRYGVSIPHGTIKSKFAGRFSLLHRGVSIPQGTIKRRLNELPASSAAVFQFHKVRLKGLKYERCDC